MLTLGLLIVVAGVPTAIAVLHQGYPVTSVDLSLRAVWVTNDQQALAGRLNRQIDELTSAVNAASGQLDVLQDGAKVFVVDAGSDRVEAVDQAYASFADQASIPVGASVGYGGDRMVVVRPSDGAYWIVDVSTGLRFDANKLSPNGTLGPHGQAVVGTDGTVFAYDPDSGKLTTTPQGGVPTTSKLPVVAHAQLSAVGDTAVVLDTGANRVLTSTGAIVPLLGATGLRIQQPGPGSDSVLVAAADGLIEVPLAGGSALRLGGQLSPAASTAAEVAAPVLVDGCAHAAFTAAARYVMACDGEKTKVYDIQGLATGAELVFRANLTTVALNDVTTGNVWLADHDLRLVDNWSEVTPPADSNAPQGNQKSATQSFADTLAQRTAVNHPPVARDDHFGVRPGRATELPVLMNDTDPDGDVLRIDSFTSGWESEGQLELVDGGRSLQFTPAANALGSFSFRYTVDDGRGGVASANVVVDIVPYSENRAPTTDRTAKVTVEQGQSITANVLADWIDPDGDPIFVAAASARNGDQVQFDPDGEVTLRNTTGRVGDTTVDFTVSDGKLTAAGTLDVEVDADGTQSPVATPDAYTVLTGTPTVLTPLDNDTSPSGAPLRLLGVSGAGDGLSATVNSDLGQLSVIASTPGTRYLEYTLGAGSATTTGLIRVDALAAPKTVEPPIAAADTVYLRQGGIAEARPLDNDTSPDGSVLAVQTVSVPLADAFLKVQVLQQSILKISSSLPLAAPVTFGYTVSNGESAASTTVTVVPVPPLTVHQAPVARDDAATVRAGDEVTVHVLDNDSDPDGVPITLSPQLVQQPSAGLAFVGDDTVRYQAPKQAGTYTAMYAVHDDYGQTATATVTFTVVAATPVGDRAPQPVPVVERVYQGQEVTIPVTLDGIDPDGDSTQLVGFPSAPQLGQVGWTANSFTYTASSTAAGTDAFSYEVQDPYGLTGVAAVRIAVIPRPAQNLQPVAQDVDTSLRPGRSGTVDVLTSASDPNGYNLTVSSKLTVPSGVVASVVDNQVELTAPNHVGAFVVGYTVTDGHGGVASANIAVTVKDDAPYAAPTAADQYATTAEVLGHSSVTIDPRLGSGDPSGRIQDLQVALTGPNAGAGTLMTDGTVRVATSGSRQIIAYTLTDPDTKLSGSAFIVVPPNIAQKPVTPPASQPGATATPQAPKQPPVLRPDLKLPLNVQMNQTKTWKLSDLVYAPSGRPTMLVSKDAVVSTESNGTPSYLDATDLTFTPAKDYRGQASITFTVTDGASPTDPNGNVATLTLNLTVGDPNFLDESPTFTTTALQLQAGTSTSFDLQDAVSHPNPAVVKQTTFDGLSGASSDVQAQLSGATLQLTAPTDASVGTIVQLNMTGHYAAFSFPATVTVTVVSSSLPLPTTVPDHVFTQRSESTGKVNVLQGAFNPFPETPLKIVSATVENPSSGATATVSNDEITVVPNSSFIGDIGVSYVVQDATNDHTRRVDGSLTVTVWDVPVAPPAPSLQSSGDSTASVIVSPTTQTNGTTVTGYTVTASPGGAHATTGANGGTASFSGLSNGTSYTFTVTATAKAPDGTKVTSDPSASGAAATPYGVPSAPQGISISNPGGYAPQTVTLSWAPPATSGGGSLTYHWTISGPSGGSGTTSGTSASVSAAAGTYSGSVQVCNSGGQCSATVGSSNSTSVTAVPSIPTNTNVTGDNTCVITYAQYAKLPTQIPPDCGGYASAGQGIHVYCRGQRNYVFWYDFDGFWNGTYYQGWYILDTTTNRSYTTVPICGKGSL